jgi:hypothetical protein
MNVFPPCLSSQRQSADISTKAEHIIGTYLKATGGSIECTSKLSRATDPNAIGSIARNETIISMASLAGSVSEGMGTRLLTIAIAA